MDVNPSPALIMASRGVRYGASAALFVLALFLFVETLSTLSSMSRIDTANVATITVNGTGKASVAPDIAHISFTVQEQAKTVAAAQDAATKRTNDALAAIKKLGIADADVKTSGYNVYPQYETPVCPPGAACPQTTTKISGYQVSQSVEVKVRDTAKAGDVLQQLGTLGVQNISGPDFGVDDPSATQADARGKAIADARAKAEVLAKQLGVHLGRVVGYSENNGPQPYPMYGLGAAKSAAVDSVAPTLPTGTTDTTANVTVIYEIRS